MTLHSFRSAVLLLGLAMISMANAADSDRAIQQLQSRLERLERAVDNQGVFEMQRQINSMDQEIQDLRGELERLRFELDELKAHQREMFIAVDKKLKQVESTSTDHTIPAEQSPPAERPASGTNGEQRNENATSSAASVGVEDDAVTSSDASASPALAAAEITEEYKTAFILLKQRKFEEAISAFNTFLGKYPDSKYSANAQYWVAEAKYVTKQYRDALVEFKKVVEQYPASSKVPDARLKIGFTYYELEQWEDARVTLSRLKAQFPNSDVAGLAQQRLERMSREGH